MTGPQLTLLTNPCESCGLHPVAVIEPSDDSTEPYRVCRECHRRLIARALRPREWFNLASRHGWQLYLLHDDFYDENGVATQPEHIVDEAEQLRAPTLDEAASDPERLLDYTVTRWRLEPTLEARWANLPAADALACISGRFAGTSNTAVRAAALDVAAMLGPIAAGLVRHAWSSSRLVVEALSSLGNASASCLPIEEGLALMFATLATGRDQRWIQRAVALSHFHSPKVLEWIEANIGEPISESWGYLAAASSLDWATVERWLQSGRPLSLVAIDALRAIADPRSLLLKKWQPQLLGAPTSDVFTAVLTDYARADRVPRVRQRVDTLLQRAADLTARTQGPKPKI